MKKKIAVLGCTGSIGTNTLDIIREFSSDFAVCALTAHSNQTKLEQLAAEFNCIHTLLTSEANTQQIYDLLKSSEADIVVNGIAGSAGLKFSAAALELGIHLALANKETLVMAAKQIKTLAKNNGCMILPVDSEHSAIFSMIERFGKNNLTSVILTASGGPFRTLTKEELACVTAADALKHPTWNMGQKITIDSATLANKGLEVIEACALFDLAPEQVQVTVHPQSLVHSFIRTADGVLYAQISPPDMRHPILNALMWPDIVPNSLKQFDPTDGAFDTGISLTFYPPRLQDFPMLALAYDAIRNKGSYTIAYNAANEVAAHAFLAGQISFQEITDTTRFVLEKDWSMAAVTISDVLLLDTQARKLACDFLNRR